MSVPDFSDLLTKADGSIVLPAEHHSTHEYVVAVLRYVHLKRLWDESLEPSELEVPAQVSVPDFQRVSLLFQIRSVRIAHSGVTQISPLGTAHQRAEGHLDSSVEPRL